MQNHNKAEAETRSRKATDPCLQAVREDETRANSHMSLPYFNVIGQCYCTGSVIFNNGFEEDCI
jgi:hypothetical protein